MTMEKSGGTSKLPFEEALDKTGFGLYNVMYTCLAGLTIISYACVAFANTLVVPASACELAPSSAQQGAMMAAPVVGNILGAVAWGALADRRGRRAALLLSLPAAAAINALASLSVHWAMLMVMHFLATFMASGQYPVVMALLSESVPAAARNLVVLLVASISLLSQGIMSVMAIPILPLPFSHPLPALGVEWTSWRALLLVFSLPGCISFVWLFFMQESPKFLLAKGDAEGALEILKTIQRVNKGKSKEFEVDGVLLDRADAGADDGASMKEQVASLFRAPLLKYTLIMTCLFMLFSLLGALMLWLPTITNQFTQTLQAGAGAGAGLTLCGVIGADFETPDDPDVVPCAIDVTALLMVLAVCSLQFVVSALLSVGVQFGGRRNTAMAVTAVFGVCGVLVNMVPHAVGSAALFAGFLMGIVVLGTYTAMCVALFPTHLRAMAVALVFTGMRVVSFAAIQLINYLMENHCELGFYLFGSLFAASALILALLPDDRLILKAEHKAPELEEEVRQ